MKRLNHLQSALLCAALVLTGSSSAIAAPSSHALGEARHASGIALVGPGPYQPRPANRAQKAAYHAALRAAQDNPDQLGYPWLDAQGHLVQRNATTRGLELAQKVEAAIPRLTKTASHSYGQLEEIKDEIIDLRRAGFMGADLIWKTQPDEEHNRIIVTVSRLDDGLMTELAKTYGTQAIAVHVMPQPIGMGPDRYNDSSPYSGGAAFSPNVGTYSRCTTGFAFSNGLVTAGHCLSLGGDALTAWNKSIVIGTTQPYYDENWKDGTGTVPFPGYNETYKNRGDLALIKTASSNLRPRIYMGTSTSAVTRNVSTMWDTESSVGEQYCTSGSTTGQLCEWTVIATRLDVYYNETNETVRNVTEGYRYLVGTEKGDSGGAVYTYNADWSVSAKGIHSGSGPHPSFPNGRVEYFTEILQASAYFGGTLKTGSKIYWVINDNSDKCLDVEGDATGNGVAIIQYECHGRINQQWYFEDVPYSYPAKVKIVNERGKCLSIDQNLQTNGAKAHTWTCFDNNDGQQWVRNSNGTLVNNYGKCLGIDYNSADDRARVTQWDCIGAPSQKWVLFAAP